MLLRSRSFFPLWLASILGAVNDNLIRAAFVVMAAIVLPVEQAATAALAATGLLMLPFFLFSGWSGALCDRFDKTSLLKLAKLSEFVLAILACAFFVSGLPLWWALGIIFLMGTQSAFFGPIKQGWLPERLDADDLVRANAWLDGSTQLAIVLGTVLGGTLFLAAGPLVTGLCIIAIALTGLLTTFLALPGPSNPAIAVPKNPLAANISLVADLLKSPSLRMPSLLQTWFWGAGAISLSLLPILLHDLVNAQAEATTFIMALFSIGVALGALVIARTLKSSLSLWTVPLSAIGIAVSAVTCYVATLNIGQENGLATLWSTGWGLTTTLSVVALAAFGGAFVVPLHAAVQHNAAPEKRGRQLAGLNILNAFAATAATAAAMGVIAIGLSAHQTLGLLAAVSIIMATVTVLALPRDTLRSIARCILMPLLRVEITGAQHLQTKGRVVFAPNHTSLLDGPLMFGLIERDTALAIQTGWADKPFLRPLRTLLNIKPIDPTNAMSAKHLASYVEQDGAVLMFPEGRVSTTGGTMKLNPGVSWLVDTTDAQVVAIHIDGLQRSKQARPNTGWNRIWFPKVRIHVEPPKTLALGEAKGKTRRQLGLTQLRAMMEHAEFQAHNHHTNLVDAINDAKTIFGPKTIAYEDLEGLRLSRGKLDLGGKIMGHKLKTLYAPGETVGVLLPAAPGVAAVLLGFWRSGRIPAMLNPTVGAASVKGALTAANAKHILSSKAFIEKGGFQDLVDGLKKEGFSFTWTEDIKASIGIGDKVRALIAPNTADKDVTRTTPAAILFTSGTEGTPKGVVLTHGNLLSNIAQIKARTDIGPRDIAISALPLFHSFGLTAGMILPLLTGVRTGLHPSPLHYKIIPILAYNLQATLMFGTDTFLNGWAKRADPEDFSSLRAVVAGAEAVKDSTRNLWSERFGVRILEGYGATECSPVLSLCTPSEPVKNTVGRLLPGMTMKLETVPGVTGKRLIVNGPNIMAGYLHADNPGVVDPPKNGWYDTGDVVSTCEHGYIKIVGRVKRFAKVAGEMVPLGAIEAMASTLWPETPLGAISIKDDKGEKVILAVEDSTANRADLLAYGKEKDIGAILMPAQVVPVDTIPMLASGKIDYPSLTRMLTP